MKQLRNAQLQVAPPQAHKSILAELRVLVIDDDADARELVSFILASEGAIARVAASAQLGFQALHAFCPQLLVSDIGMPDEDGYSLLRRVRALPAKDGGSISAIALSAFQTADDRRRALAAGFDIHLGKPIAPAELLDAARFLANRQSAEGWPKRH